MRFVFGPRAGSASFLVILSSLTLSGCNALGRLEAQSRVDPRTIAIYPPAATNGAAKGHCAVPRAAGDYRDGAIRIDCVNPDAIELGQAAPGTVSPQALAEQERAFGLYHQAARGDKIMRNRLAAVLMKHSDDICTVELGQLTAREAMVNTGLGMATSALSTISALVMGDFAKTALASGASFTNASRDHINAEVYRNILSTAISSAIDEERARTRQELVDKFPNDTGDYSVDQMVMEVNRFHQGCSFYHGIGLVLKKVNRPGANAAGARRSINVALNDIDGEIARIDRQLNKWKTDDPRRAALVEQRAELVSKRTALLKELADARLIADEVDTVPNTPKDEPKADDGAGGGGAGDAGGTGDEDGNGDGDGDGDGGGGR
jgi:hypothetical protein